MIFIPKKSEYVKEDTEKLIYLASIGEHPCNYCEHYSDGDCSNRCRAWPIWFSVRWRKLQEKYKR